MEGHSRWWWTATGIVLIVWALQLFASVNEVPLAAAAMVLVGGWGLATIVVSLISPIRSSARGRDEIAFPLWIPAFLTGEDTWMRRRGWALLARIGPWATAVVTVGAFFLWAYTQVRAQPSYGTDELAFNQYAASLTLHGVNPYIHSMQPSFTQFRVSPDAYTFKLNGAPVTSLSYPALSFLIYVPFLALGWTTQLAVIVNVAAWGISTLLLFHFLPRNLRAVALVIASLSTYVAYAVGGITDAVYVPFLLGAAATFDWLSTREGLTRFTSPALFGLAMALKQTPWFILPFVLAALACESRLVDRRRAWLKPLEYLGVSLAFFALPNIYYAVSSPSAWARGVMTPFLTPSVPAGQGLVGLSLFLRIGGGALFAYTVVAFVVLLALLAVFITSYPLLRSGMFVLPSIVLFFAQRSFGSYLIELAPIALLAAARVPAQLPPVEGNETALADPRPSGLGLPWRRWRLVAASALVTSGAAVVWALTDSSPLSVSIIGIRTTGQLATVERVTVRVTNDSSAKVHPAYSVESSGTVSAFWPVLDDVSPTIGPHSSATLTLLSPNFEAQPPISGGFSVVAFSQDPSAVSTSPDFLPQVLHVALEPSAVSGGVPLGRPTIIRAQLLDSFDRPVRRADVPVYLGQIIYDQHGLVYGSAVINDSAPGLTPVSAVTSSQGVATFVVIGTQPARNPVYFEANLVNLNQFFPYGYSNILTIRFGNSS